MGKSSKGSAFERDFCKQLSLWWTEGRRDDVFWRTAGSGAMATSRGKHQRKTFGQYGDVQATDPIGQPLIDLFHFELKRGYSYHTIQDLLDKAEGAALQKYESFLQQTQEGQKASGSYFWVLVLKRDRRKPIIIFPIDLYNMFLEMGKDIGVGGILWWMGDESFLMITLESFFSKVHPSMITKIANQIL